MTQELTTYGDGRDINPENEEIPEWARPYIRTLKQQVNTLEAQLLARDSTPSILREADALINGPRHEQYGDAAAAFKRYAVGWSEIIGAPVTAEQVCFCMVWLKMMRESNQSNRDNRVDAAGYLGLADNVIRARLYEAEEENIR